MKNLQSIYNEHSGHTSDKWELYLREYDELFTPYRERDISILEIGVQNGGSLEIWANFFPNARAIVGCDINSLCKQLSYTDPKINVIVEDANTDWAERGILQCSEKFDLIIDDGSHKSADIIRTFARYFKHLTDGGLFIVEDLHCSYWKEFGGGLYHPFSAIQFFKQMTDVINYEHWGIDSGSTDVLKHFYKNLDFTIDQSLLAHIHSIQFINSLCVIRKKHAEDNLLGKRHIVGEKAIIDIQSRISLRGNNATPSQRDNPWSLEKSHPMTTIAQLGSKTKDQEERLKGYEHDLAVLHDANAGNYREISQLNEQNATLESQARLSRCVIQDSLAELETLKQSTSWKLTRPVRQTLDRIRRLRNKLSSRLR